jgi:antitoxin CcdA
VLDETGLETPPKCAYIMRMENTHALGRQRLNLTLPGSLVEEAKALGLNLSRACESGLEAAVAAERARRWQAENRPFFDWYNAKVEKDGLLLAEYRQF